MKKYHQLLLLIVSIISLSLFLIYRHQYNRLHYVLEVFNFFGTPCNFTDLQQTNSVLKQHDWGPQPVWQETETGNIYSAFLTGKVEVKSVAVISDVKNVPKNCYIWFEEKKKPMMGKFKLQKIARDDKNSMNSYFYICSLPNIENTPYAVSYVPKIKSELETKKILVSNTLGHKTIFNTTICISPSVYTKKKLLEFISFHRLIGIDSFIFYDKEIPHRLVKLLTNLSNKLSLHVSFLPWNFPKSDNALTRTIVENDCVLRTFGQSKYVITLELNEYIVPTSALSFDGLMSTIVSKFQRLALPIQRFCVNSLNVNKPMVLQNFEAIDDFNFSAVKYLYNNTGTQNVNFTNSNINRVNAFIHKYIRCNSEPQKTVVQNNIANFATDFIRTTLVQLLIHNQI